MENKTKVLGGLSLMAVIIAGGIITFTQGNREVRCDFSQWGNCSQIGDIIYCDSKYDGNADGICQSGESCIEVDVNDNKLKHKRKSFNELDKFNITCERV